MIKKEKNLVVLAAGIGSRFKGGVKQLQSVGPCGECIMDYSVYDAMEAGFNRIVFIIRHDIEELFEDLIGRRIRGICAERGVEVVCAFQDKTDLPAGYHCPADRVKPWGTGHALLSCRGMLHGGFVVINADDYYGKAAYWAMSEFLDRLPETSERMYALAGFRLENTLSENGGVTRGLCHTDEEGFLTRIRETKNICKDPGGPYVETEEGLVRLDGGMRVSMNMWAFTPDVLDLLENRFRAFLAEGIQNPKSEFLIPTEMGGLLTDGLAGIKVLQTPGQWFGMTYAADTPAVQAALAQMAEEGSYPSPLF